MSLVNRARVVRHAKHLGLPLLCGIAMQVAGLPHASPAILASTVPSAGTADSGTYGGTIGLAGGDDWYSFVPISSGPARVGSCASDMTADYDLDVRDAAGQPIVGAGAVSNCQFVSLSVTAGQTYQVHVYAVSGTGPYVSAWSANGTSVTWPLSVTITGTSTSQDTDLMALTPGRIDGKVCGPSQYTFSLLNGGGLTVAQASNQLTNCAAWSYQDANQGLFRVRIDVPSGGGGGTSTGSVVTQVLTPTTTTATSTPVSSLTPTQTVTPTTTASPTTTPTLAPSSTATPVPTTTATTTPLPPTTTATATALPPTNTPTPRPTNTVVPATPTATPKPGHKH